MSETDKTRLRVKNSKAVLGSPHDITWANSDTDGAEEAKERLPVVEGEHYTVLASTMWGDYHVPTIVKWAHGETDTFTNKEKSLEHREKAKEAAEAASA